MKSSHPKSFRTFAVIWSGQFVSILGSGLSSFGLSVWILTTTKSAMSFAMTFLVGILPSIFFSPLAGSVADRKNRKLIMIVSDTCDAGLKIVLAILWLTHTLTLSYIYIILFLSSVFGTFQAPAFNASLPEIVPKEQLGRANGMMQLIMSVQNMVAPIVAGILYPVVHLGGLLAIDIATYVAAFVTLIVQRIPQPQVDDKTFNVKRVFHDLREAYLYIRGKVGLLGIIFVFMVMNFIASVALVLVGPMVLSRDTSVEYGVVNSASGLAMVLGALLAGLVPTQTHRVRLMFLSLTVSGLGLIIMGVSPLWFIIAGGFFVMMLPVPYANSQFGTIIQMKVDGYILGRVSALMTALIRLVMPLAFLCAGVLADNVFNPLLAQGGPWSNSVVARLIGCGATRGTGLIFILCGLLLIIMCGLARANQNVMHVDTNNPDVVES